MNRTEKGKVTDILLTLTSYKLQKTDHIVTAKTFLSEDNECFHDELRELATYSPKFTGAAA